jgi:hypothetical protein
VDWEEQKRYETELKQLLATPGLSPDARVQGLAALLLVDAMSTAAEKIRMASQTTLHDTAPFVTGSMNDLTRALENFNPGP